MADDETKKTDEEKKAKELVDAAFRGEVEAVRRLLDQGVAANATDEVRRCSFWCVVWFLCVALQLTDTATTTQCVQRVQSATGRFLTSTHLSNNPTDEVGNRAETSGISNSSVGFLR